MQLLGPPGPAPALSEPVAGHWLVARLVAALGQGRWRSGGVGGFNGGRIYGAIVSRRVRARRQAFTFGGTAASFTRRAARRDDATVHQAVTGGGWVVMIEVGFGVGRGGRCFLSV